MNHLSESVDEIQARLLDSQHHPLPHEDNKREDGDGGQQGQEAGREAQALSHALLDENRQANVNTEGCHHRGRQRTGRESTGQDVQHAEEGGGRHLRDAGVQENAFLEKNKSL